MKKYALGSLLVWLVLLAAGLVASFTNGWRPVLGLDLQGGLSATLVPKPGTNPPESSVAEATNIIRQRVDGLGIAEPDVVRSGKTVVVQLPGLKTKADQERAKSIIGTTAKLEFRQVLADLGTPAAATTGTTTPSSPSVTARVAPTTTPSGSASTAPSASSVPKGAAPAAGTSKPTSKGTTDRAGATPVAYELPSATTVPPTTLATGTTVAGGKSTQTTVPAPTTTITQAEAIQKMLAAYPGSKIFNGDGGSYLLGPALFDGTVLSSAEAQLNTQSSQWEVNVKVKGRDQTKVNNAFNECYAGKPTCPPIRAGDTGGQRGAIAMVLDNKVISAPTVNAVDLPKNPNGFVITGNFTNKTASELALQLRYGALPVEFQPATLETVSATLGSNSMHAAIVAGLIGLAAVAIYMLAFYRLL
ncbi:MAG: hypothetical protein JST73_07660, partial [Actinobacteria bacterium]|nr:hypothetical protein [Actinomycetota bacterium]